MSRSSKALQDVIGNTWKMQGAASDLRRKAVPRMETIATTADGSCADGCDGKWLECALEVLTNNHVYPVSFSMALRALLEKGRGKYRNIMIVGPANCAKTFLLLPLKEIFRTFSNPSNDKYAWIGAENAEVIFLNDFRWTPETIAWKDLLLLLEGQEVHLPAPKNHFTNDLCIDSDTPIFATGKGEIKFVGKYNSRDDREDEMMGARWKVFTFFSQIPEAKQREIKPCAKCFCDLVLMNEL